jgi:hypothetical protein
MNHSFPTSASSRPPRINKIGCAGGAANHFQAKGRHMSTTTKDTGKKEKTVVFIDKQKFELDRATYTVGELLALAGENSAETTLVLKRGNDLHKYTDPNEILQVKDGMQFVVFSNAPTPVS